MEGVVEKSGEHRRGDEAHEVLQPHPLHRTVKRKDRRARRIVLKSYQNPIHWYVAEDEDVDQNRKDQAV